MTIQPLNVMEYQTQLRYAEVRVTVSNPDDYKTHTESMALSEEHLEVFKRVGHLRRYMEAAKEAELPLAMFEYQRAMQHADEITQIIAATIAHALRRSFEDPVPRTENK